MKKLSLEEKKARKETREKDKHDQLCKELYRYWDSFYRVYALPEYAPLKIPEDRAFKIYMEHLNSGKKDPNFTALLNWNMASEEFRCKVIVDKYSSTHNWVPHNLHFKCKDCGYQASKHAWLQGKRFAEEVVKYPHYDMENHSIHYTCAELKERYNERKEKKYRRCKQCGVWGCPFWWRPDGSSGNYKL